MAEIKIPLDSLILKNKKTYLSALGAVCSLVIGYIKPDMLDPSYAQYIALGLLGVALFCSRLATADTQAQIADLLSALDEVKGVLSEDPGPEAK